MTLKEYFKDLPKGSISGMADRLNISRTWFSLIINKKAVPGAALTIMIEKLTYKRVLRKDLRPDLYR